MPAWIFIRATANDFWVKQCNKRLSRRQVRCPCCGWEGFEFLPLYAGVVWTPRTLCPQCGSYSRQRALWEYIVGHDKGLLDAAKTVLHFAPERAIAPLFRARSGTLYLGTDFDRDRLRDFDDAAFLSDITQIPLPDAAVDLVICVHVLEHIVDEAKAIRELHRVLRPGGVLYIMIPVAFSIDEDIDFGGPNPDWLDHCRVPGRLYSQRLAAFQCNEIHPHHFLPPHDYDRMRIQGYDIIYRCTR